MSFKFLPNLTTNSTLLDSSSFNFSFSFSFLFGFLVVDIFSLTLLIASVSACSGIAKPIQSPLPLLIGNGVSLLTLWFT